MAAAEIAQVGEPVARVHVPVGGPQLDDAGAVRQAQAAAVGAVEHLLDAGDGAQPEERDETLAVERRAVGQAQRERAAVLVTAVGAALARAARSGSARTPRAPSR